MARKGKSGRGFASVKKRELRKRGGKKKETWQVLTALLRKKRSGKNGAGGKGSVDIGKMGLNLRKRGEGSDSC